MFSPSETMEHMHKSRVISVHRMCWRVIPRTRALWSARNASAAHKANHTIECLDLDGNKIGDDGAIALADAIKVLLMMLCFLWNMTGILVTRLNTASLPTCSLARMKTLFCCGTQTSSTRRVDVSRREQRLGGVNEGAGECGRNHPRIPRAL